MKSVMLSRHVSDVRDGEYNTRGVELFKVSIPCRVLYSVYNTSCDSNRSV